MQLPRGVAPPGAQCWWLDSSKVTKSWVCTEDRQDLKRQQREVKKQGKELSPALAFNFSEATEHEGSEASTEIFQFVLR